MKPRTQIRLASLLAVGLAATLAPGSARADTCAALDAGSFDALRSAIQPAVSSADQDVEFSQNRPYPGAAVHSKANAAAARQKVVDLQTWLNATGLDASNASAAANMHGYMREAISSLQLAAWWALVSASSNTSAFARSVFEQSTVATDAANALGLRAGRCYLGY